MRCRLGLYAPRQPGNDRPVSVFACFDNI
jgi:hypothetical protein